MAFFVEVKLNNPPMGTELALVFPHNIQLRCQRLN